MPRDKEKKRQSNRAYFERHKEQIHQQQKEYRLAHKEQRLLYDTVYRRENKMRRQTWAKEYQVNNHDKVKLAARRKHLRSSYGLTVAQYEELLRKQNGRCVICKSLLENEIRNPAIDHCHKTGMVRGILCQTCNSGLAFLKTVANLERAIKYLKGLEIFDSHG